MLTEEMDNCADDYRQTDQHPIAAMHNEAYEVPPAYSLPDRMNEYYDFLQKPDIHPLIKAAVAQAYLLVTRPFPEGNERLSRMMSSAVLMRCGYDFFRDISISSVIARESYRYYKSMCEIIRSENGGDLTYFLQYYIELLVRALDARNERQRKREQEAREREQEALRKEQELAKKPLTPVAEQKPLTPVAEQKPLTPVIQQKPLTQTAFQPCEEDYIDFWANPDEENSNSPTSPTPDVEAAKNTVSLDIPEPVALPLKDELQIVSFEPSNDGKQPPGDEYFQTVLARMEHSRSANIRHTAEGIKSLISKGIAQFSCNEWSTFTCMSQQDTRKVIDYLVSCRMIKNTRGPRRRGIYVFVYSHNLDVRSKPGAVSSEPPAPTIKSAIAGIKNLENAVDLPKSIISRIKDMATADASEREHQISAILTKLISNRIYTFQPDMIMKENGIAKSTCASLLKTIINYGIVRRDTSRDKNGQFYYSFNKEPLQPVRYEGLSQNHRKLLSALYTAFREHRFSIHDASKASSIQERSMSFHLTNLAERGILKVERVSGGPNSYAFAINPKDYPQSFLPENNVEHIHASGRTSVATIPLSAAGI